ncbi:MAG: MFS transporter, partial [Tepidiformaceae bacterium]
QLTVPDHLRGRVMSIFFLLFAGSTPIGGWLTGTFAEIIGVRATLGIEAGICAIGVATAYAYRLMHSEAFAEAARTRAAERISLGARSG